ncbi:hypothetical protein GH714_036823 [Hevea brasiliensis]|uniref:O-methyltransferase domain-containing protein n=1 Tax=Hevea brasiliensis TaxID=3981 RepID=A0A6A6NF57_HEVBR|nr:hypothetical protein GH714_036823 [Hevea brasiliensis]
MERQEIGFTEDMLRGQATIWQYIFAFVDGMALKCVLQLGIPDIINSNGRPMTLSAIAKAINHPHSLDTDHLSRVMALLVRKGIFSSSPAPDGGDTLYGVTNSSMWLLSNSEMSLAPFLLLQHHPWTLESWHYITDVVKAGGKGFTKSHNGQDFFKVAPANPEFSNLFNKAMAGASKIIVEAVKTSYKDGFNGIETLVDVGGGIGAMVSEIVKAHPHIKGVNFDLPFVVAEAPDYVGVTHVAGDMFKSIPQADALLLKWIMHSWNDEDCIKILKNCREALSDKKKGKLIIIDTILSPEGNDLFDDAGVRFDLLMMTQINTKERSEAQFKILLKEGGFPSFKIIKIPALVSIIEAYPQ